MRLISKVLVASGGLLVSLTASAGIASAQSDLSPVINTTCTYPQVIGALTALDPGAASQLTSSPFATGWLQGFINAGPDARRNMATQVQNSPGSEQFTGLVLRVADTCQGF